MTTLPDLTLDEQLAARVFAAERRLKVHPDGDEHVWLSDEEGLVSPGARRRDSLYRRSLMIADAVAATVAVIFAVKVVGDVGLRPALAGGIPLVVLLCKLLGLYDRDQHVFHKSTLDEAPKHLQLAATYMLLLWLLSPWLLDGPLSRRAGLALGVTAVLLTALMRAFARDFARRVGPPDRCLVMGRAGTRLRLAGKLTSAQPGTQVVGYLPLEEERRGHKRRWDGHDRRRKTLTVHDLPELARQLDVHRVIIIPGEADPDTMIDAVSRAKAAGVKVSILPRLFEVVGSSVEIDDIEGVTVLGVRRFGLSRSSEFIKRSMDVVGAGLGLIFLAPLFAIVAVAIKLDSEGPVFYTQSRTGRNGRAFRMYKFRSMVDGADGMKHGLVGQSVAGEGLFKLVEDPRTTRVGRIIRKFSIDELPQLFNVLGGEMSLVGPRPLVADEAEHVRGHFQRRLRLVPGMTGPWQILGPTRVPLTEMVGLDYLYGANWSLWVDVKILIRTVGHVLSRRGV